MSNSCSKIKAYISQRAELYSIRILVSALFFVTFSAFSSDGFLHSQSVCKAGSFEVLNPQSSDNIHTSEHFVVRWNNEDNVQLSDYEIEQGLERLEEFWVFYVDELGFEEPYCDTENKYKVSVNVSDQGWATGAGTGERDPEMWVHYNAFNDGGVLAHEFTHTLQFATRGMRDSKYVGWLWESHAEWMRHQYYRDDVQCAELMVNFPHLYYGSTRNRYCNWLFWEFTKNEYGYATVNNLWSQPKKLNEPGYLEEDPFTVLARNMDWSVDDLNDHFGKWAMHNAVWDYINPDGSNQGEIYKNTLGSNTELSGNSYQRVTRLMELEDEENHFAVSPFWAPQRWGYNLVRLKPEQSGIDQTIHITFEGIVQDEPENENFDEYAHLPEDVPSPDSDWRWGVAAVDENNQPRYSELQKGAFGDLSFEAKSDDREIWLVVMGTPSEIHQIEWDQPYFSIYRYPWLVEIEGALPQGTPDPNDPPAEAGEWHENGGGWVADEASVDASAYVGPNAQVLGGSVRFNARVEDHAVIQSGLVSGDAVVGGLTMVTGDVSITGRAEVRSSFMGVGAFENNHTVTGSTKLLGDIELRGYDVYLSNGVYYGLVDESTISNPDYGSNQSSAQVEVTSKPPYIEEVEIPEIPRETALEQNYPNPFNPSTTISYDLPQADLVTLKVYGVNGKLVRTLVDDYQNRGNYEIQFDADNLASRVYFYRLKTSTFNQSRKLSLIK